MSKLRKVYKKLIVSSPVLIFSLVAFNPVFANEVIGSSESLPDAEVKTIRNKSLESLSNAGKTISADTLSHRENQLNISSQLPKTKLVAQGLGKVNSVSGLSDVQPTDWAFQALQSLVERYGCIAGYPNGTFRGNRAMTRYEFAAGLNACLDRVNELIATSTADLANKQDLETIQKLQAEFSSELATLQGRVDALEARTTELEQNQFSTTTILNGEALFSVRSVFNTDERPSNSGAVPGLVAQPLAQGGEGPFGSNTTLGYRVRLEFNTSFTGKDLLLTRLEASNIVRQGVSAFTNMGALQPDDATGDENNVFYAPFGLAAGDRGTGRTSNGTLRLDTLSYTVPWTDKARVRVIATGGKLDDFAPTLNALDYGGAGLGSITEFGQRNPIYRLSGAGAGAGLDYKLSDAVRLSLGYLGGNRASVANPSDKNGLFNGTYGAIAQLTVSPSKNVNIGLTYVRSYFSTVDVVNQRPGLDGGVGSHHAALTLGGGPTEINSYGLETSWRVSPKFTLGGWAGVSSLTAPIGGANPLGQPLSQPGGKATVINWAVTLAFPDLFKPGSLGGLVIGQPPKVTDTDGSFPSFFGNGPTEDYAGESFHIEAFYRYALSPNISITPGVVVITNPEYNSANPALILGTVRTTFTF
jgi:hypothetical protein